MTLEVRIPISPKPAWLNRVRLIAASIRQFYPDALVTVSCYPPISEEDKLWLALNDGMSISSPSDADFNRWANTRAAHLATMMARYKPPFYGDHILMLDADVLPIKPFPEMFDSACLCGVQAHHSPYGVDGWRRLFHDFGLPPPRLTYEYSGWGIMENRGAERYGPFYPNSGVVFGPRWCFEALAEPYEEAIEFLRENVQDAYWHDQTGFALGVALKGLPTRALPARFNHPNRPAFDAAKPEEVADLRFVHFMDESVVHRDRDFETPEAITALCTRTDFCGSNEVLRKRIGELV